jgi:hypothetical protein
MVKKRTRDVDRIQEAPRAAVDDGGSSSSDEVIFSLTVRVTNKLLT